MQRDLQPLTTLYVNEIFQTMQGEGFHTGTPATFVRLQGCPIGCPWCDTKQTWHFNKEKIVRIEDMTVKRVDAPTYAEMTPQELLEVIETYDATHVVITGGEPCLYDLRTLTTELLAQGHTVQIETSGTHQVLADDRAWVTVSPKISMPGGYQVLDQALARANEIKFPIGKPADFYERLKPLILDRRREIGIKDTPIYLQPLSLSQTATQLCINLATLYDLRVSIQTHKFIGVR